MTFPSVTRVMGRYSDFSRVPQDALDHAAWRGTEVHRLCAAYAQGLPIIGEIPPACTGYFLSYQHWFDRTVETVRAVEPTIEDPIYQYIGHPDLIARLKGDTGWSLWDLKTPRTRTKVWQGQLAAYHRLCGVAGIEIVRLGVIQLHPEGGDAKLTEYEMDGRDLAAFLAALTAHRYFSE